MGSHHHDHTHHHHTHEVSGKNLLLSIVLNSIITLAQVIGGLFSGSLALIGDALHNFSDVLALIIAWWTNKLSLRQSTESQTFGYKRAEILATLINATALLGIGLFLIVQSVERFWHPQTIDASLVIYLALLGVVFNLAGALLIKNDAHNNMNMRAAYLHLMADVMTSVSVLVGGVAMMVYGWYWVDSVVTIAIALYLIKSSYALVVESTAILMQFSPQAISLEAVEAEVLEFEAIDNIHHIHLWQLSDHETMLEAHVDFKNDLPLSEVTRTIEAIEEELREHFGIAHVTLQAEYDRDDDKELIVRH